MFNTDVKVNPRIANTVKIQACSGGIYKSHPKSRIVCVNIGSVIASRMLECYDEPTNILGEKIVVLQAINVIGEKLLVEYMLKEDYENENIYFNPDGSQKNGE